MRAMLIVLAGAYASLTTSLAVWIAVSSDAPIYYEVLDNGMLQTTASENQVNLAVAAVLEAKRPPAPSAEERLTNANYREAATAWFTEANVFGHKTERASRLERRQTDRDGRSTRIEVLRGTEMPTLVFVHHDDPTIRDATTQWIGGELAHLGVGQR